jgi:hypothetical protein
VVAELIKVGLRWSVALERYDGRLFAAELAERLIPGDGPRR